MFNWIFYLFFSGVPQSSILGLLFFLIYINDLPNTLSHSKALIFANDTKCFSLITKDDDCLHLQSDIDNIHDWSVANCLFLDGLRTFILQFHSPMLNPIRHTSTLNGNRVQVISVCKDLGVYFNDDLDIMVHPY